MTTAEAIKPNVLISSEEAAQVLDIPLSAIGHLVREGRLRFYQGTTFIRREVLRFAEREGAYLATLR